MSIGVLTLKKRKFKYKYFGVIEREEGVGVCHNASILLMRWERGGRIGKDVGISFLTAGRDLRKGRSSKK